MENTSPLGFAHIDISTPESEFDRHLALNDNKRILFSGQFGTGKSYFLRKYFLDSERPYIAVPLFPTLFSISDTTDVLDLIRSYILADLMVRHDFDLSSIEPGELPKEFHRKFFWDNLTDIILGASHVAASVPQLIPGPSSAGAGVGFVGKVLPKLMGNLTKVFDKYQEEKRSHQEPAGKEKDDLDSRLAKHPMIRNSILDESIALALGKLLDQKNDSKGVEHETILILDDVDRLPPDQIFRILNVFSAHFHEKDQNKFGFDRVILVCDLGNLENIFHARFGAESDFKGYIDKFHTYYPFRFDNRKSLSKHLTAYLNDLNVDKSVYGSLGKETWAKMFGPLLALISEANPLSVRDVKRQKGINAKNTIQGFDIDIHLLEENNTIIGINTSQVWVLQTMRFFHNFFGSSELFLTLLNKTLSHFGGQQKLVVRHFGMTDDAVELITSLAACAALADYRKHGFSPDQFLRNAQKSRYPGIDHNTNVSEYFNSSFIITENPLVIGYCLMRFPNGELLIKAAGAEVVNEKTGKSFEKHVESLTVEQYLQLIIQAVEAGEEIFEMR